ncbi:MAG: T9SS type A sorting domain-containing protein [Crocinitomix sp.]|nr:T9SS type A sorting domain-containing protein [Crocinitomix sp.]
MKKVIRFLTLICVFSFSIHSYSQCDISEGEVTIVVHTDDYGNEGYWELVPSGNDCGVGTIFMGGNDLVGCDGAGEEASPLGGYPNNEEIIEGDWCLPLGNSYDIIYIDDWGDGAFAFDVLVNGYQIASFDGIGLGGIYTFTVEEPPVYDLSVFGSNLYSYVETGLYDLEAHVFNGGTATITSFDLNYSVDGGATETHNVTGVSVTNYNSIEVEHSVAIDIPTDGVYSIKMWADNINIGNEDLFHDNDTLTKEIEAGPGIPNDIESYIDSPVTPTLVAGTGEEVNDPTDLDFHPVLSNMELWVVNRGTEATGSNTVTIYDAGGDDQTTINKEDGNAWHFMSLTTGLAFSENGNFATSPGVYDANHNGGDAFTGPTLWSSDMTIYAEPSGGNGSHLDMLHQSPYCQGIAAEKDNVFWLFDGNSDDIVRYDFAEDHGPGNADHSDGIVRRYSDDEVIKDASNQIVSHLVLDKEEKWLYVVDHGNQRVIRIDITTGADEGGTPDYPNPEPIEEYTEYTGYTQELVVSGLSKPAGVDVIDNRMIVSEYETGEIIIYDITSMPAIELSRLNTGLNSVQGLKIGPDGKIWFVDQNTDGVYRLDQQFVGIDETVETSITVYPNPSKGNINIVTNALSNGTIEIRNTIGELIYTSTFNGNNEIVDLETANGLYFVSVYDEELNLIGTEKIMISK